MRLLQLFTIQHPVPPSDGDEPYSIIDFYGIKSFGHYAVRSYTLCGDTMQLMKEDGIMDWNVLKHPLLFEQMDVQNLNISYRQSEELQHAEWNSEQPHGAEPVQRGCVCICKLGEQYDEVAAL